jgi:ligand-binding SRPBCC domain-containing protein
VSSHFSRTVRLPVPAAEAFAWHERPGAFERLAPPWQRVAVLESDHALRDGARVRLRAQVAPPALAPLFPVVDPLLALAVPDEWVVEHRDYVPGRQFRDVMLRGPFASWTHLHRVEPDGPGASRLTDVVDYALPFGAAGRTLGGAFAGRELDRLFAFRHAVTAADLARHADARARGVAPLTVAVTGASGLVGSALVPFLTTGGHSVVRVGRGAPRGGLPPGLRDVQWDPERGRLDPAALEGVDVVIHLAGANVGGRWTAAYKQEIAASRVDSTRLLAETIARMERRPRALVSMSASGYYGDRGDELLDESAPPGRGFLAEVAVRWEAAADAARAAGVRVAHPRLGVVLSARGGALAKLLPPFQAGLGGPTGWRPAVVGHARPRRRRGRAPPPRHARRRERPGQPHPPRAGPQRRVRRGARPRPRPAGARAHARVRAPPRARPRAGRRDAPRRPAHGPAPAARRRVRLPPPHAEAALRFELGR